GMQRLRGARWHYRAVRHLNTSRVVRVRSGLFGPSSHWQDDRRSLGPCKRMRRADDGEFQSANELLQLGNDLGRIVADQLRMKRNPHAANLLPFGLFPYSAEAVQGSGQSKVQCA